MNAQQGAHLVYPPARTLVFHAIRYGLCPNRSEVHTDSCDVSSTLVLSIIVACSNPTWPHFMWTPGLYVISRATNRSPPACLQRYTGGARTAALHVSCLTHGERVQSIYWKQFHVPAENYSMYLLDRVPRIYWKQFQLSTGKSSRYLFERVSGIYLKVPNTTGKSSRYALERGLCGPNSSVGCGGNRTSVTLPVAAVKYQNWHQTFMPLACIITHCRANM